MSYTLKDVFDKTSSLRRGENFNITDFLENENDLIIFRVVHNNIILANHQLGNKAIFFNSDESSVYQSYTG